MKNVLVIILGALMVCAGCRKKPNEVKTYPLTFSFKNMVGNDVLSLNDTWYKNQNGDSFKVSIYKYYISNIVLTGKDGTEYKNVDGYYLIDESKNETKTFTIQNVPKGHYTKINFLIGVDSARNVSGAETGALDPVNGMYWDWNTGYIMAKLEGSSPQSPNLSKDIIYHIGGFNGPYSVLRSVTLNLPEEAPLGDSYFNTTIVLRSDVLEWFKTPTLISIANFPGAMNAGKSAQSMADNYIDMFTVEDVIYAVE